MLHLRLSDDAVLVDLEPWHAQEYLDHIDRGRAEFEPWIPTPHRIHTLAEARASLQDMALARAEDRRRIWGIRVQGVLRGGVMFPSIEADQGTCELGVWLEAPVQGRGLVTEACRRALAWAFEERGLHRVGWHCDPRNEASRAVARRLGMSPEGLLRSEYLLGGTRRDTEVWSLLAPEWRERAAG